MSIPIRGAAREPINRDELDRSRGSVIVDDRRSRPLFFDGRFLAARDLTREQQYFLARQADLGRALGGGIVQGLTVERTEAASSIRIAAGHGSTPAGEMVVLSEPLTVNLLDIPTIQRLNATFGLAGIPREPARSRTGLFVVGLRPVEFTANPIASYPTTLTGPRGTEDGEIVEGVAVTLVPYQDDGTDLSADQRRGRAAYEVFVNGASRGTAASVLPLAMISLNRGIVQWLDTYLVRRATGAERADALGLGHASRGLREAYVQQFERHLQEVLELRAAGNRGRRFAASEHFFALPPAGRMPSAAINPRDFTQVFFPPEVTLDLSIIPEDELPPLLEESLLLPPIDLTLSAEELESTSVLALLSIPRSNFRKISSRLGDSIGRTLTPPAPWLVSRKRPLELLQGLPTPGRMVPLPNAQNPIDETWRGLLASAEMLWYVRRRNVHERANVAGEPVQLGGAERLQQLVRAGQLTATASLHELVLLTAARLEREDPQAGARTQDLLADPRFGEGLAKLEAENPELKSNEIAINNLVRSGAILELDQLARTTRTAEIKKLSEEVTHVAVSTGVTAPTRLNRLVTDLRGGGGE